MPSLRSYIPQATQNKNDTTANVPIEQPTIFQFSMYQSSRTAFYCSPAKSVSIPGPYLPLPIRWNHQTNPRHHPNPFPSPGWRIGFTGRKKRRFRRLLLGSRYAVNQLVALGKSRMTGALQHRHRSRIALAADSVDLGISQHGGTKRVGRHYPPPDRVGVRVHAGINAGVTLMYARYLSPNSCIASFSSFRANRI